jgi:hypothetical protein
LQRKNAPLHLCSARRFEISPSPARKRNTNRCHSQSGAWPAMVRVALQHRGRRSANCVALCRHASHQDTLRIVANALGAVREYKSYEKSTSYMRCMISGIVIASSRLRRMLRLNMETQMKENQAVKPVIDLDGQCIIFEVRNKTPLRLDMTKVHEDNVMRAAYVGMAQVRIVDAAAIGVADKAGRIIPVAERDAMKYARMQKLIEHYESGSPEWTTRGQGAGTDSTGLIKRAIMRVHSIEHVETLDALVKKFADEKHGGDTAAALRYFAKGEKVAKAMLAIKGEELAPVLDADSELDALLKQ